MLLREGPVGSVLNQPTARSVAARAGRTTGAFFHHWRSQEAYRRDLLAYVLDPARIESVAGAGEAIVAGIRSGGDPVQVLEDRARQDFQSMRADPYIPLGTRCGLSTAPTRRCTICCAPTSGR